MREAEAEAASASCWPQEYLRWREEWPNQIDSDYRVGITAWIRCLQSRLLTFVRLQGLSGRPGGESFGVQAAGELSTRVAQHMITTSIISVHVVVDSSR